jgi:hypothetical protein
MAFQCVGLSMIFCLAIDALSAQPATPCPAAISLASSSITFYPDPDRKKGLVADIFVRNDGATPLLNGSATVYLFDFNGKSLQPVKVQDEDLPALGSVVIGAHAEGCADGAKQVAQTFVIPSRASASVSSRVVLISAVAALIALLIAVAAFRKGLKKPMGASEWSFSASAATNLTVTGTLLTGVLVSSAVPDYPHYITKQGYWVLSLLFGILASLAPVLYNFCCKPTQPDSANPQSLDFQGSVWLFLLSAAITVWAVSGQLATLTVMFREFALRKAISGGSAWAECAMAVAVAASLLFYCFRCAKYYIEDHPARRWQPAEREGIRAERPAEVPWRAAPRWTAF